MQVDGAQKKKWLFNLTKDPTEKVNLAKKHPKQVAKLEALIKAHWKHAPKPHYPNVAVVPVSIDKTLAQPYQKGDELVHWPN